MPVLTSYFVVVGVLCLIVLSPTILVSLGLIASDQDLVWPWQAVLPFSITMLFATAVIVSSLWGIWKGRVLCRWFRGHSEICRDDAEFLQALDRCAKTFATGRDGDAYGPLGSLIEQRYEEIRDVPDQDFIKKNDPLYQRIYEIKFVLKSQIEDSQKTVKLTDLPREMDGDRPLVARLNGILMITLFAGIIGTFVGLMQFIVSPELAQALNRALNDPGDGPQNSAEKLDRIFHAFQPAFFSSLLAYTSYIFVRYERDSLDEAFQAAAADFNAYVQRPLKTRLKEFRPDSYVDFSATAAAKLNGLADRLESVHGALDSTSQTMNQVATNFQSALKNAVDDMQVSAQTLESASTQLGRQFTPFATALSEASTEWQRSTTAFRETFEAFNDTASDLQANLRQSIHEIDGTLTACATQLGEASARMQQHMQTAAQELSKATAGVEDLLTDLKDSAQAGDRTREAFDQTLASVQSLVANLQETVDQLPATLRPGIDRLAQSNDTLAERIANSVDGLHAEVREAARQVGHCAAHLAPDEDGTALASLVSRIDQRLANGRGPAGPSAPGAGGSA